MFSFFLEFKSFFFVSFNFSADSRIAIQPPLSYFEMIYSIILNTDIFSWNKEKNRQNHKKINKKANGKKNSKMENGFIGCFRSFLGSPEDIFTHKETSFTTTSTLM